MNVPTGESLASNTEDYEHDFIPGASHFFQIDKKEFSLNNFKPTKGIPSNPKEYLKNVMFEAQNCPDVVVAKMDPGKIKSSGKVASCIQSSLPGGQHAPEKSWIDDQIKQFSSARHQYMKHQARLKSINKQTKKRPKLPIYPLPTWKDEENWRYLCLGSSLKKRKKCASSSSSSLMQSNQAGTDGNNNDDDDDDVSSSDDESNDMECTPSSPYSKPEDDGEDDNLVDLSTLKDGYPPLMRILLRMESRQIEANLDYHSEWMHEYGFSHQQGKWIYALLTCLQKPLFPTVTSALRDLSRKCAQERINVADTDPGLLCGLNVIIAVIGSYFNQYDLLDNRV